MEYGNPAARVVLAEHDWHFEHLPTGEVEVILASDITGTFSFSRPSVTFWSSFQRQLVIELWTHYSMVLDTGVQSFLYLVIKEDLTITGQNTNLQYF